MDKHRYLCHLWGIWRFGRNLSRWVVVADLQCAVWVLSGHRGHNRHSPMGSSNPMLIDIGLCLRRQCTICLGLAAYFHCYYCRGMGWVAYYLDWKELRYVD
jgi:hypothetical protein